jgi:hypothetical protein
MVEIKFTPAERAFGQIVLAARIEWDEDRVEMAIQDALKAERREGWREAIAALRYGGEGDEEAAPESCHHRAWRFLQSKMNRRYPEGGGQQDPAQCPSCDDPNCEGG